MLIAPCFFPQMRKVKISNYAVKISLGIIDLIELGLGACKLDKSVMKQIFGQLVIVPGNLNCPTVKAGIRTDKYLFMIIALHYFFLVLQTKINNNFSKRLKNAEKDFTIND